MHFVDLGESFLFFFRRDALKELSNEHLLEKYYRSLFSRFSIEEYCRSLFRRLLSQYSRLRAGEREAIRLAESAAPVPGPALGCMGRMGEESRGTYGI